MYMASTYKVGVLFPGAISNTLPFGDFSLLTHVCRPLFPGGNACGIYKISPLFSFKVEHMKFMADSDSW